MKILTILDFLPQIIKAVTIRSVIKARNGTEWAEIIEAGRNQLSSAHTEQILNAWHNYITPREQIENPYNGGQAAEKVLNGLFL